MISDYYPLWQVLLGRDILNVSTAVIFQRTYRRPCSFATGLGIGENAMKVPTLDSGKTVLHILVFVVLLFWPESLVFAQAKERDYWPTSGWKSSAPELQGMDPARLEVAVDFIESRLPDAYSLLVVKNGYLVLERYFSIGRPDRRAVIHSVTKSVMSALIGIALDKGHLRSVDQKLVEFLPEYFIGELDPMKRDISLKHLLTMTAGLKWNDWGPIMRAWYSSPNWTNFTIQLPQESSPGRIFNYNSSLSHLLSVILSKSTKMNTLDYANQNLFEPLGVQEKYWQKDPQGFRAGGFGLALLARDLAKIGFLYLNEGVWNGRSLISKSWVRESTRQQVHVHNLYGSNGYGYQWWIKEVDGCFSYGARGRRGQFIVVVPELDLVIVVTSETAQPHPPTSLHYLPLFDLVAKSVRRERPAKESVRAVELPYDARVFLKTCNQALSSKDIPTLAKLFSNRFLESGKTKEMYIRFLSGTISYVSEGRIIFTKFESDGNIARIEGMIKDKYFEAPFMLGSMLIKEDGQWKWYGNQVQ